MKNKLKFSPGNKKYVVEPIGKDNWEFRKIGDTEVLRKNKLRALVKNYAIKFCESHNSELTIYSIWGSIEEKYSFDKKNFMEES
jgi:hypothetical protein